MLFNSDVTNDTEGANILLKKADEIEEKTSHQRREKLTDTKTDEIQEALVTVSGSKHNLGEIVSVNTGAVKMFGYTRAQFIGINVSRIVPPPYRCDFQTNLLVVCFIFNGLICVFCVQRQARSIFVKLSGNWNQIENQPETNPVCNKFNWLFNSSPCINSRSSCYWRTSGCRSV